MGALGYCVGITLGPLPLHGRRPGALVLNPQLARDRATAVRHCCHDHGANAAPRPGGALAQAQQAPFPLLWLPEYWPVVSAAIRWCRSCAAHHMFTGTTAPRRKKSCSRSRAGNSCMLTCSATHRNRRFSQRRLALACRSAQSPQTRDHEEPFSNFRRLRPTR